MNKESCSNCGKEARKIAGNYRFRHNSILSSCSSSLRPLRDLHM